ncbi:hypothetical protein RN96_06755 [Fusobacterium polymorphum]|uniref:Transposase IS4-like domain-containing protein n=1 Tax=Fusobacterium nucleatum subsp. polymorphum TaxID=76857 RepID=A0A2B7YFD3_FUSNP|nr:hypothetical protein [Fusobacterium polymorphum]PGH22784.1 hypothetical protein RN96_06755 [Fusobacterium polymorphum]
MYVAITGKGKSKVVQFCEQHRIAKTNKKKTIVIKTIGNYETLLKENPNIIFELKEEAKKLTEERKKSISKNILFRFGHSLVYSLWKEIGLSKILGETLSKTLFSLVIYRLGSSYSTFLENRKTPFLNLESVSHLDFYETLLELEKKEKDLIECFNKFFEKKVKRDKKLAYYHISSYKYNSYWKVLYSLSFSDFQKVEEDLNFDMVLLFDSYGIPISYQLYMKEKFSENKLKGLKKILKISKFILVSTQENKLQDKSFISPILFEDLNFEIQKEILKETKWKVIEKDIKTDEVLEKDKIIDIDDKLKLYVYWAKKRAFKDYIEKNNRNGYIYIITDEETLEAQEISNIFQYTWNIEDKFKITDVDFSEKHLHGHFTLCYICLCIIRYFQYLLGSNGKAFVPMIYANKAISNPMIFMEKKGNELFLNPIHLTNSYLKLSKILGLGEFSQEMSVEKFEKNSGLKINNILL